MCGLAGAVRVRDGAGAGVDLRSVVQRMCDIQAYRGPDDSGVVEAGQACLGSRRLSIIDLSAAGHMPMSDPSGRWWIAYNGEVYNFAVIREAWMEQVKTDPRVRYCDLIACNQFDITTGWNRSRRRR